MSNYIPPDAHNISLNLKDELVAVDSHNLILNFGADEQINAAVNAGVATSFIAEIVATQYTYNSVKAVVQTAFDAAIGVLPGEAVQVSGVVETSFYVDIQAIVVNQSCRVEAVISTSINPFINARFDINSAFGLSHLSVLEYQRTLPALLENKMRFGKPLFKAHNSAFVFERGLTLSNAVLSAFEKSGTLHCAVRTVFEETTGLASTSKLVWQENDKRFIASTLVFEESEKLLINRHTSWDEMIKKRKKITFSHEVAAVFEKWFTFKHDNGLELVTTDSIPWEVARAVYYRKSSVDPIEPQPKPEYVGSTDLNFSCHCVDVDSHNVILNFGASDYLPISENKELWYIVNDLNVSRLDNGQTIQVNNGDYRCDRSSWCWSYNLTIPFYEKSKTEPIDGKPMILKIMINGNEHRMLLENISRSRQFGKDVYKLSGRSPSALLDAPYSPTRSFTQENERTSVQLVQAELDRVNSDITLNWELIDALGWVLPANSLSYSNLTPMDAIKLIADAAGGFVYSEPNSNTLTIKPLYKKVYWDAVQQSDFDRLIPESVVIDLSTDYALYPDYNGVFLTNDRTGETGTVKRRDTAGDVKLEPINDPLFTSVSAMHEKGRSVLAKAGMVESHSLLMPVANEIGLCTPSDLIAFNAEWWGVADSVSGSFSEGKVTQTVSVERVNHE
ncbi:hypothetical protein NQU59_11260 [Acinetobacter colistiniresistens]|uniref:hypothetical protein n=1 Tax=Acinetobacter colistiniresistens TaxID=280145 RepID=UPI00211C1695|nr:hypothetical protein [Acinetobacter colistiniresistens]UUM26286.1 hypothetical protein NQU59_11260 [Acinetobacter colistiniresistens]